MYSQTPAGETRKAPSVPQRQLRAVSSARCLGGGVATTAWENGFFMNGREGRSTAHAPRPRFYEWVGIKRPRVRMRCAPFFMNGGPEKNLTRDCWGWLLLLKRPSFFYKEGWRLLLLFFFFFLNEWRAAATAAAGSAARAVPPPSLREEVKATFTPLRASGTVSVA